MAMAHTSAANIDAFETAALTYLEAMGLETPQEAGERNPGAYFVFHVLVGMIEFCDSLGLDFEEARAQARQHFAETQSR